MVKSEVSHEKASCFPLLYDSYLPVMHFCHRWKTSLQRFWIRTNGRRISHRCFDVSFKYAMLFSATFTLFSCFFFSFCSFISDISSLRVFANSFRYSTFVLIVFAKSIIREYAFSWVKSNSTWSRINIMNGVSRCCSLRARLTILLLSRPADGGESCCRSAPPTRGTAGALLL